MDPRVGPDDIRVPWRPELVPTAVILVPAPFAFTQREAFNRILRAKLLAQFDQDDGLHILLQGGHQLWLPDKRPDKPLAVALPLDDDLALRAAGAWRLYRLITSNNVSPAPRRQALTAQQHKRLAQMLRALDGHLSRASYREIASVLFGRDVAREKGWKTHPIRGATIRLVRDAVKMMNRGYLKLLRGR